MEGRGAGGTSGAPSYPKTIDWRIVLSVYGTSNAMEIQLNWQREYERAPAPA